MKKTKLCLILRGAQGSGKSTFAERNKENFEIVSADSFFVKDGEYNFDPTKLKEAHALCRKNFEELIEQKKNVIIDNTNAEIWEYQDYVDSALNNGYVVYILTFNTKFQNIHNVPDESVEKKRRQVEYAQRLPEKTDLYYHWVYDFSHIDKKDDLFQKFLNKLYFNKEFNKE